MQKLKSKLYNFLRWSEKYTKTDMLYLAKGGFWLTLGQVVSSASIFLIAIAFANLLPRETYGTYKYVLSLIGILAIATLSGMSTAITQAVARGYEGSFLPALKTKIRWGLLGGLASLILAGYYYFQGNTTLTISFLISAAFLPFMDSLNIYGSLLTGRKLFNISTKFGIVTQIISAATMVSALFLTNNIFLILFTYFISHTLLRFIFLKITLKKFLLNKTEDPKTIPYGKHLSLINVLNAIAGQLDKILLFHFLGSAPLAIYSFAIAPVVQIRSFLKPITPLSLSKLAVRDKEELKKTLPMKMFKFFILLLIIAVIYIILAPYFYKIFFPQYLDSIKYSQYFALVLLFFPKKLMAVSLLAHNKTKELYFTTSGSLVHMLLLFILIPLYGIFGVITAELGTHIFNTFLLFYLFRKM